MALSAAIILASLEALTVRLAEAGGAAVTAAVAHKYGATAGENAALATGVMRNVVLVYAGVRGLDCKAVVKHVGKSWAKGRVASARAARAGASSPKKVSWGREPFSFFFSVARTYSGIVGLEQHNEE